jgi:hypothetical protein
MGMGVIQRDALLDNLVQLNQRLLSLEAVDLDGLREALHDRSRLMTQVGRLLRDQADVTERDTGQFRADLNRALEDAETAVHRLLSLRQTVRKLTV